MIVAEFMNSYDALAFARLKGAGHVVTGGINMVYAVRKHSCTARVIVHHSAAGKRSYLCARCRQPIRLRLRSNQVLARVPS